LRLLALAPAAVAAALLGVAPAAAAADDRLSSLRCQGDMIHSSHAPVLLIHGTGVTAEENWAWGYEKALLERGGGVCTIDLPRRATIDMQDTLPITAAAIRAVARRAGGRRIATIGHSQGAAQAVLALRFRPRLARRVDDVIGLAGAYDRGSDAIAERCATRCIPPFWQFVPGSNMLASLATRAPPPGPSFTAIGTLYDTVVTPQPEANAVPGGRSIQIQDICSGRRFADGLDHIHMAGDAVAYALAIDALDHPGPADPARVSPLNCALDLFPEADAVRLATLAPQLAASFQGEGSVPPVDREPRLRCPFATGCDVLAAFRLARHRVRAGGRMALRVRVARAGRVRLRFASATTRSRAVALDRRRVWIRAPRLRTGVYAPTVEAQSVPDTPWARLRRVRVRITP
jgi:pimeloyl-ACP methyl ester carboxylesterase